MLNRLVTFLILTVTINFTLSMNAQADATVTGNTIVIGQTAALAGTLSTLANSLSSGIKAHFEQVNSTGGVNGRKIKFVQMDDTYNAEKAVANVNKLIQEEKVFALLGVFGTPVAGAIMPIIEKERVPLIAPYTGADSIRKEFKRYHFTISASYAREIEKMVEHLSAATIKQVSVVYQNNGFGKDGLAGAETAFVKYKIKPASTVALELDSSNVKEAVTATIKANPAVIIMATAGKATLDFISAYRAAGGY